MALPALDLVGLQDRTAVPERKKVVPVPEVRADRIPAPALKKEVREREAPADPMPDLDLEKKGVGLVTRKVDLVEGLVLAPVRELDLVLENEALVWDQDEMRMESPVIPMV